MKPQRSCDDGSGTFSARANAAAQISAVPRIAIVGRGFSGMMTAIALMKTVRAPFHLQLFDPNSSVSGGQALASVRSSTILNTRVRDLSVSVGDNDDFNDWLCSNAAFRAAVPAAIPGFRQIFVPKEIFSDYVYQRFSEALAARRTSPSRSATIRSWRSAGATATASCSKAPIPPIRCSIP